MRPIHGPGSALYSLSILKMFQNPDNVDASINTVHKTEFQEQTGWERLRIMFKDDGYGNFSPELTMVINGAMMGAFTGTLIGGTIFSKANFEKFIEENQGTAFQNTFDAKKQLQTKVTMGFARGAWMWGWRLSFFCGTFMLLTTSISVYRGKSSLLEYIIAGGATGATFKLKQGPRAIAAGGIIGGALGTIAGCLNLGVMYITGTTMEDLRYWQHQWKEDKEKKRLEQLRNARNEDLNSLTLSHESQVDQSKNFLADQTESKK